MCVSVRNRRGGLIEARPYIGDKRRVIALSGIRTRHQSPSTPAPIGFRAGPNRIWGRPQSHLGQALNGGRVRLAAVYGRPFSNTPAPRI